MAAVMGSRPQALDAVEATAVLPLAAGDPERVIAFDGTRKMRLGDFLDRVRALAGQLPDAACAINLCQDRFGFLLAFCAVALRGQVNLLPPARTRAAIDEVRALHPGSYCLGDVQAADDPVLEGLAGYHCLPDSPAPLPGSLPQVDADAVVAIGYTSGSTGVPAANAKRWGALAASARQNLQALQTLWPAGQAARVVATVPSQHMYGIEMAVLFPLLAGAAVHVARPFFPGDIAAALRQAEGPRLLVTTPLHLRALVSSGVALPPLAGIVSATAPLPQPLAVAAEARFGCPVREMFGSTETCIIASRRTATETLWTPFPGVEVQPQPDGTRVTAPQLSKPVVLADLTEVQPDGRFRLHGRKADLLEIAGKRASLSDLTQRLLAVPGVRDGVVVQLDGGPDGDGVRRIAALAVAPGLDEATILDALRKAVDPVFLPRRLRLLPVLPRNETGKLPRAQVLQLLGHAEAPA